MATLTAPPVKPMLCQTAFQPFDRLGWIFQPKLDGSRVIAKVRGGSVSLQSRDGRDITHVYPEIVEQLRGLKNAVLDGEVVVLDEQGRPDFNLLQQRSSMSKPLSIKAAMVKFPAVFYVFDILNENCIDLTTLSLKQRLDILKHVIGLLKVPGNGTIRMVTGVEAAGKDLWTAVMNMGLEGIVAKKLNSKYQPGRRSDDWIKIKKLETSEFVVMGYTQGTGYRAKTFGALVVGTYQTGKLEVVGEVGSGFTDNDINGIFGAMQPTGKVFRLENGTAVTAVKPEIVIEIRYMERTKTGALRQPVFMRLRTDKRPTEC